MNILVNASNLRTGGGLQVAESIVRLLNTVKYHHFIVVLPKQLEYIVNDIPNDNIRTEVYSQPLTLKRIVLGRDSVLDKLVEENNVDAVLTVFGPSRWKPTCFHLCGFAMPHIVLGDSPYWKMLSVIDLLKSKLRISLMKRDFRRNNSMIWCENEYISAKLRKLLKDKSITTITNNYNQVFDHPEQWETSIKLQPFDGLTLLTITANYPHKNIAIAIPALEKIKRIDPNCKVRFVFTINEAQYPEIPQEYKDNIVLLGPVKINQCPPLYSQADVMFQPSLLECFSATYAEAMKMELPIITTDLGFAHSLCGDAALYYSPTDPEDLAKKIYKLYQNETLFTELKEKGTIQLKKFDTSESRFKKLIDALESAVI